MYTCRVKGQPIPCATWEKDDVILKENNHFKMSVEGDETILEILNITKSDAGCYTCRLTNSSGETSQKTTLVVKEKADFRSVLKTRPNLGKPGLQNGEFRSSKDSSQVDFRQVLRRNEKDRTPPGGRIENKPKSKPGAVQQMDFRNVLKPRSDKKESPVLAKSELVLQKSEQKADKKESPMSVKSEIVLKNSDQRSFEKESPVSLKSESSVKIPDLRPVEAYIQDSKRTQNVSRVSELYVSKTEEQKFAPVKKEVPNSSQTNSSLKNRVSKFENSSKEEKSLKTVKNVEIVNKNSLDSKLERHKPKGISNSTILQKMSKFEQSSGSGSSLRESPPFPLKSKPKSDVLEKYSLNSAQNGQKSNTVKSEIPKDIPGNNSLKSRMAKFDKVCDSSVNNSAKVNKVISLDDSRDSALKSRMARFDKACDSSPYSEKVNVVGSSDNTWKNKSNIDFVNIGATHQKPLFKQELIDQRVKYGNQAVLKCAVSHGDVDWTFNGRSIKSSKFFKMDMTPENVVTLTIAEAYSEDEGEYMCTVSNKFGSATSSCKLIVEASSSLSSRSDIEGAVTIPARLLSVNPASLAVMPSQEVRVKATFRGEPKPEVRWFKGREEIQQGDGILIENSTDQSVLIIEEVLPEDAGKYIVAVENHAGRDSLSASVSVEDVPEPPGQPQANDIMSSSVMLWWCGPPYDGGSQITHYKVQMKKAGDNNWTTVTPSCKNTFCQVAPLEKQVPYYFRVFAANKHGFSRPGEDSSKIFTSDQKLSIDYESDDELPFEPREVKVVPDRKFEDHYEVKHEVGKGKFGYVYQCKDKETGKIWAAKVLKCREKDKANILHEIEIMNELAHPKLMMIWDAFEAPRSMTLVMEFVGGGELFERVISDDFELTEGDCIHFMRQICDGVAYIHDRGILHLDLKPENILCISDTTNQVKIIDFGLARRYNQGKSMKVLFGTPEFIAPEVINYDEISFATDMWSLGVICYLLLSGLSPFLGDNDAETLANVTRGDFDFDDESFDDITENAKNFITCLLVKVKEKRMLIKDTQQHVWLAQDERRIRNKRLNTDRLKRFMARRKWQVHDEAEIGTIKDTNSRVTTLSTDEKGSNSPEKKKTCSDHNGNIEIHNSSPRSDDGDTRKPYFLKEMLDCEAFSGDVVRFDVRVAGSPGTDFHWLQDEEEVQEDRRHIVEVSDNGQCSLIIRNVIEDDEGEYTCVAVNKYGEVSCSADLIVSNLAAL